MGSLYLLIDYTVTVVCLNWLCTDEVYAESFLLSRVGEGLT